MAQQLTLTQATRLRYALALSEENMRECGLTTEEANQQLHLIVNELLVRFATGAETPNAPTETYWCQRAAWR